MTALYVRFGDTDHVLATFRDPMIARYALFEFRRFEPHRVFRLRDDPVIFFEDRPLCYSVGHFTKKRFVRVASFAEEHIAIKYLKDCRKAKPEVNWDLIKSLF